MKATGKKIWAIPGGYIPLMSNGKEPELLSQDKVAILNTGNETAGIKITVFYNNHPPVQGYEVQIKGQRLRKIRINDLINPFPVNLKTEYALLIESDKDIIVQFLKMNTAQNSLALMGTMAFGTDQ